MQKGECLYILKNKIRYYTKEIFKLSKVISLGFLFIITIILIKYKPVYSVSIDGEEIGYIKDKNNIENYINDIYNTDELNIAFAYVDSMPEYEFSLVNNKTETDETEIKEIIDNNTTITYTAYAITVEGENRIYLDTMEEAQEVADKITQENDDINIGILQVYSENLEEIQTTDVEDASITLAKEVEEKTEEEKRIKQSTVNGVYLAVKPISGTITSRYGSRWGTTHTGLDIATSSGTPIKAVAGGTVTYAGVKGSYGNLVIINHGNGVQTYYAHCSKIYVSVGDKVEAGDVVSAVGSTGNSTGPHLHLEVRINGTAVNPQRYLYK